MDVNAVIKQNFVYRMLFRDMYRYYRTFTVIRFTRFNQRHSLILA